MQGGPQGRAPPGGPNSFHFHAVFGKNLKNSSNFGSWRTPWGKSWTHHWIIYTDIFHNAILSIDTSNNAWYKQAHWLIGTKYLAIIASNDHEDPCWFTFDWALRVMCFRNTSGSVCVWVWVWMAEWKTVAKLSFGRSDSKSNAKGTWGIQNSHSVLSSWPRGLGFAPLLRPSPWPLPT